jgi:hypothetical protein
MEPMLWPRNSAEDQSDAERERRVYPAGHRLSRNCAEHRPRKASLIGLSAKDVVDNVITAMTSDGMVAPSYWIDPKSGNNYMVTVQYANSLDQQHVDGGLRRTFLCAAFALPATARCRRRGSPIQPRATLRRPHSGYTPLSSVADIQLINTPTEVDHYQIRRVIDIYVATKSEALQGWEGRSTSSAGGHQDRQEHGARRCAAPWSA